MHTLGGRQHLAHASTLQESIVISTSTLAVTPSLSRSLVFRKNAAVSFWKQSTQGLPSIEL